MTVLRMVMVMIQGFGRNKMDEAVYHLAWYLVYSRLLILVCICPPLPWGCLPFLWSLCCHGRQRLHTPSLAHSPTTKCEFPLVLGSPVPRMTG